MRAYDEYRRGMGLTRRQVLSVTLAAAAGAGTWLVLGSESPAGPATTDRFGDRNQALPRGQLPDFARAGGSKVEEAYRYALEQGDALESIPCFCGCTNIGHRHNRDCYIKSFNRDGTVTWTSHSAT